MLLAVLQGQRHIAEDLLTDRIVADVMVTHGVRDAIHPDSYDGFVSTLEDILGDVQDIWRKVQHSTQVFKSGFEDAQTVDFKWAVLDPRLSDSSQARTHEDDDGIAVLFPMLFLVGDEKRPITSSTIIRKSQIDALMKEERRHARSAEPGPSRPRPRPRTMSISSNARNSQGREAFLSQAARSSEPSNA